MFEEDPQSSDEESPVPDADSCRSKELKRLFQQHIKSSSETAASLKRTCGLHLALSNDGRQLAVGLSRGVLQLYDLAGNGELVLANEEFAKYKSAIRGAKFFGGSPHSLMVCTEEGDVHLYDLRTGKAVHRFDDVSEGPKRTMTAFDINQNDRVMCASTEVQKDGDAFLLFFDIRERSFLGSYWECHSEDITNVRFHPTNPDLLSSGSVDGLINVFDISKPNEDDALQDCFNVENAIESINWHRSPTTEQDWISCITTTNDFHLYDLESQDMVVKFDREKITECARRTSSIDCNVIGTHNDGNGGFFLLAGSNYNKGECLRSLRYDNKQLLPHGNFLHNKQIVRASVYNEKEHCLLSTGESGLITVWRFEESTPEQVEYDASASKGLKQKLNISQRKKPY